MIVEGKHCDLKVKEYGEMKPCSDKQISFWTERLTSKTDTMPKMPIGILVSRLYFAHLTPFGKF